MKVNQVYQIVNLMQQEVTGLTVVANEDLSNVVEIGDEIINTSNLDNYVRKLPDVIGRVIFVDRIYNGALVSMVRDAWEYGAIMEKISADLPDAEVNESWELKDGTSYDPNIFKAPAVRTRFWSNRVTFEIDMSITEDQLKSAFSNATQLNSFFSMIQTAIQNSFTVKSDALSMSAIRNMIAETFYDEFSGSTASGKSGTKAINLLYLYNQGPNAGGTPLTAAAALTTPEFIRFASMTMANYIDRLKFMSTLFNMGGTDKFTPADRLHVVMLSDFKNAAGAYLQSDTFHDQYTALPEAETVPYWQGSGLNYQFSEISAINVTTPAEHSVSEGGILGVMFDRDALGISNVDRRTTTQYNAKAEFWNQFHKLLCGVWNDPNENFIVFYVA